MKRVDEKADADDLRKVVKVVEDKLGRRFRLYIILCKLTRCIL